MQTKMFGSISKVGLIVERVHPAHMGGFQRVYRFDNGYGASLIQTSFSYGSEDGSFELAVLKFDGESDDDYHLCFSSPVTDDVLEILTPQDVDRVLADIKSLPAA